MSGLEGESFSTQLSRWSDETVLFGPPNLRALRWKGEISYKKHGLLAANWAFIDEIFDASDVLLRTLLGILEERTFSRGSFGVRLPLQTCIATSNYYRVTEMTGAVIDRFTVAVAAPTLSTGQRQMLYRAEITPDGQEAPKQLSLAQIEHVREESEYRVIPDQLVSLAREFADKLHFSPRRETRCAQLMRVNAALRNATVVDFEDALAVIPICAPLDGENEIRGRQAAIAADIKKRIDIVRQEDAQLDRIRAAEKVEGEGLDRAQNLTRGIKALQQITPVSKTVAEERDKVLHRLEVQHGEELHNLLVLPSGLLKDEEPSLDVPF
jgi:MoxR-like ATPase